MNEFIQLKVYRNNTALANTMADIDEKVREIKEVEKGINRLFDMIKELHHVISMQNTVVDSIAEKVDQIQDHVEKTHTTTAEAKELYMGYREVC
jgi:t-SNARE complex subunit (syntaxin)